MSRSTRRWTRGGQLGERRRNSWSSSSSSDLKRGLSVMDDQWENIPEVGNLTKKKRGREERSYVVPDSVLVGDRSKNEDESLLDPRQQQVGGLLLR
ncbi:hypothetical protein L208DRAFT_1407099 [Tricholoma matsutake]|nr:hypothetical protein L208DRAFT_1407099 [Tricholoma matsutake 945]